MAWNWDWQDTFKTLIAGVVGYISTQSVKKFKPTYHTFKKFIKVIKKLDQLYSIVKTNQSTFIAIYHIDRNPIFIVNKKAELIYCNPAWVELTGMEAKDAANFGYIRTIHPNDRASMAVEREDIINHPVPFYGQVRFKNVVTGAIIITMCRTELIYNENELVETIGRLYIVE